ncbi:hypothetical protein ACFLYX_01240 [Chloroflexota bacterium]
MAIAAWILGILGGLCAVMGIITAAEVAPQITALLGDGFTAMFWLALAAVLLLTCIAAAVSRTEYE